MVLTILIISLIASISSIIISKLRIIIIIIIRRVSIIVGILSIITHGSAPIEKTRKSGHANHVLKTPTVVRTLLRLIRPLLSLRRSGRALLSLIRARLSSPYYRVQYF